jgi:hypothetical protein
LSPNGSEKEEEDGKAHSAGTASATVGLGLSLVAITVVALAVHFTKRVQPLLGRPSLRREKDAESRGDEDDDAAPSFSSDGQNRQAPTRRATGAEVEIARADNPIHQEAVEMCRL